MVFLLVFCLVHSPREISTAQAMKEAAALEVTCSPAKERPIGSLFGRKDLKPSIWFSQWSLGRRGREESTEGLIQGLHANMGPKRVARQLAYCGWLRNPFCT